MPAGRASDRSTVAGGWNDAAKGRVAGCPPVRRDPALHAGDAALSLWGRGRCSPEAAIPGLLNVKSRAGSS
jgi:hypothetical protein